MKEACSEDYKVLLELLEDQEANAYFPIDELSSASSLPDLWAKCDYGDMTLEEAGENWTELEQAKRPSQPLTPQPLSSVPSAPFKAQIGPLSREERNAKISRYLAKRQRRVWTHKVIYSCRKKVADTRIRVKGRFVTKEQARAISLASN
jgi:hypothetical protein